jgi:hypothetical protein
MKESEELLERLIAHERAAPEPEAAAVERMWTGIEGRLGGGPPPPDVQGGPPTTGGASQGAMLKIVGAVAIAGAVGAGAWAVAGGDGQPPAAKETPVAVADRGSDLEPAISPDAGVDTPGEEEGSTGALAKEEPTGSEMVETSTSDTDSLRPASRPSSPRVRPRPAESSESETFADEARLLQRIYGALKRDDVDAALRLVAEHRRRFPAGQLVQERRAVEVEALCSSGRTRQGRAKAAAFEADFPGSTHLSRVRTACDRVEPQD